jgi:hypothetical protein
MPCPTFTQSKIFRIAVLIFLVAIVSGITYGLYQFGRKHSDLSHAEPAFKLSSAELYSAFESNEADASARYLGKVLEVRGNIAQLEYSTADSTLSITLREEDMFSGVICTFMGTNTPAELKLSPGDKITVRGECSGMLMDVLLNNCVIIGYVEE